MPLRVQSKFCVSAYVRLFRARENVSLVKLAQSKNTIFTAVANTTLYIDGGSIAEVKVAKVDQIRRGRSSKMVST
jgi:hypothetical protein